MPGEGDLAGFLGGMVRGRLEEMVAGRVEEMAAGRVEQFAGREAFGQLTPQQMQQMPEYFKSGAPYGRTREGMMRWINERAAAESPAAASQVEAAASQAGAVAHHKQASPRVPTSVAASAQIRSFADGPALRSFAEGEHIHGVGEWFKEEG